MGLTELKTNGADLKRLKTDRMRRFVLEFLIDKKPMEAAIRAGYSKKCAAQTAAKLLNNPIINAYLGKLERLDVEKLELDRHEVLRQLWYCLTRKDSDFRNPDGSLIAPSKLSDRAQSVIDGYDVEEFMDQETGEVYKRKTKVRISPKATAIDMAMKHKGLFAPNKLAVGIGTTREFLEQMAEPIAVDAIETRLLEEE